MKYIAAVIQRGHFDRIQEALLKHGITGITVTEFYERGRLPERTEVFRGSEIKIASTPMLKLEIACQEESAELVVDAIVSQTKTGSVGDGSIYIFNLSDAIRIRTLERGEIAL